MGPLSDSIVGHRPSSLAAAGIKWVNIEIVESETGLYPLVESEGLNTVMVTRTIVILWIKLH